MKEERKAGRLAFEIEELEDKGAEKEELDKRWAELGEVALQEGNEYIAKKAFIKLNNPVGLKKAGDLGLKTGGLFDALEAYRLIGDEEGLRKCIEAAVIQKNFDALPAAISEGLSQKVREEWQGFLEKKGFPGAVSFKLDKTINAADQLAPAYDYGIGIAKGGLYSAYIFSLFGLPEIIAEAHKARFYGKDVTIFRWIEPLEKVEEIENKKILVLDKDIVSGRTLGRVAKEIQKYSPACLDLFLIHGSVEAMSQGQGSKLHNTPEEFRKIFYPEKMDYKNFYEAVVRLQEKMGIRWGP